LQESIILKAAKKVSCTNKKRSNTMTNLNKAKREKDIKAVECYSILLEQDLIYEIGGDEVLFNEYSEKAEQYKNALISKIENGEEYCCDLYNVKSEDI